MGADRWLILAVLFVARFSLGFQFQSAGSVAPYLIDDLGIDYGQIGTLVGLFMLPGLLLSFPGGLLGHRFGDKRVVLAGLIMMTLGGILAGSAETYLLLVLARLTSGIGAVFLFVLMTKMVADWFAGQELYFAMSIFIIGWPIGIAAAQATQGWLAGAYGWGSVFDLTAALMMVALLAMAAFYGPPPRAGPALPSGRRLSRREVWLVCLVGWIWMLINAAYLVVLSFGPTLLQERAIGAARAAALVSLMSWVFVVVLPLGGYLATRFRAPNLVMIAGLGLSTIACALIPFHGAAPLLFVLYGTGVAFSAPVLAALPAEVLPPETRGSGFGVYYLWYYGGSAFIPPLAGFLLDETGSASAPVLFAAAMTSACLFCLALFRVEERRLA